MCPRLQSLTSISIRVAGVLLAWIVLAASVPAFGQTAVQRIEVRIGFEDAVPHPLIVERLQAAAESVVERLLIGRPVEQVQAVQSRLADTIAAVLDRVAAGYALAGATAQLGMTSTVMLRLRSVGPVIRDAAVRTDLDVMHPKVRPIAEQALAARTGEIQVLVSNLPVAALEWAETVVAEHTRQIVEGAVPGYTAAVRVVAGPPAIMDIDVTLRDSRVIRNVGVRFRSSSIPTLLLDQNGPQVVSMAEPLRGLAVAFADVRREALARLINEELAADPRVQQYQIVTSVALDVGETTYVNVVADSLLFRGRVEAHVNVGARAPNAAIIAHLGRLVTPSTELFVETRLVPNVLSVDWDLGAQYQLSPTTAVGMHYTVVMNSFSAWTTVRLGRDVGVRGAWNLTQQAFEGALTYRVNEFLAGEVVATSRGEFWLRLISNL